MSLNVGESGKLFGYNTNFDLSPNTLLELKITDPNGVETAINSSRITAPASSAAFDENGKDVTYLANEYMQFTTTTLDFTVGGTWSICGTYTNTATDPDQIYHGDTVFFPVGNDC